MKKLSVFILFGLLACNIAMAQTVKRKVPFLPYTGMTTSVAPTASGRIAISTPASNPYETVYFNKGSASLRKDQRQNLAKIGKRLQREGGKHYSIVAFSTPEISSDLAQKRANTVIQALSDFKVGSPVVHIEHRASPVINPNRVEVYMRASTNSLGTASSNFGQR